jgi:hypothetical protein
VTVFGRFRDLEEDPAVRDVVVKSFQTLDGPTKHLLGIDSWSVP